MNHLINLRPKQWKKGHYSGKGNENEKLRNSYNLIEINRI